MTLGWQEIFLVMIFALIVFGPKRLPEIGRQIGRAVREVRRVSGDFEREIRTYTDDLGVDAREFERTVRTNFGLDEDHSRFLTSKPKDGAGVSEPKDGAGASEPKGMAGSSPDGGPSRGGAIPAPEHPQPVPKAPPEATRPAPTGGIPAPERPQAAPGPAPDAPRG